MNKKFIAIPAIALAAGISLAACSSSSPPAAAPASHAAVQSNGLPAGAWSAGWNYAGVMCGPPTSQTNGRNTSYRESNGVYTVLSDPAPAVCNSATPPAPTTAPKHLTHIMQSEAGNTIWYRNYWSNGSVTTCTVTSGVFADGAQDATGDCAPDGVPSGISGGNAQPN